MEVSKMAEVWDPDHPVLHLLRDRRRTASMPLNRTDGARLGLAIDGGAMRGIVSASMLVALEDFGFANAFDVVYGCSIGAINGAYFLAGSGAWYPASIYHDDLTTRKFLDMRKLLMGRPPLDLDYAFKVVLDQIKPLDYQRVVDSRIPLRIAITLVDEARTLVPHGLRSGRELKAALMAGAWLPLGMRGTATFRGQRALDGGLLAAMPFWLAEADGCTHILSLSTRPMPTTQRHPSLLNKYMTTHLDKIRPGLGAGYSAAIDRMHRDEMRLMRMRISPPAEPPYIFDLALLPESPGLKRHELRRDRLMTAARSAYEVAFAAMEGRTAAGIRSRRINAIPRLTITERRNGDSRVRLVDTSASPPEWGPEISGPRS
jgi:predicted patatin/cPLA2 family phospholipase